MKPVVSSSSQDSLDLPQIGSNWGVVVIIVAFVAVAVGAFFAGYVSAGGVQSSAQQQTMPPEFQVFWDVWNYVDSEYYYDIPSVEERTYGAIRGMLSTLGDDHTAFVQPSIAELDRGNVEGMFGGIGAYVGLDELDNFVITYPFPDQPAAVAGIEADDIVLSVDGQSLAGLSLTEGTALIRGPIGTVVALELYRPATDETFIAEIERAEIEIPTVQAEILDGNIGYLYLFRFNGVATIQLQAELETLLAQDPRAIIFDLRGNGGGLLDEAISVSDLFLPEGTVATQRTSLLQDPRVFYSVTGDIGEEIPLVVLVDFASASASEIFAGAVQDRGRGVIVGTTTFGKGSIQLVHDLFDGSQLRLTYGAWYTPNDTHINGVGIQPDIVIDIPEDGFADTDSDPWLDAAREYIDEMYPVRGDAQDG